MQGQEAVLLYQIVGLVSPVLVGVIGWFIVRNVNRVERDIDGNTEVIDQHSLDITRLNGEVDNAQHEIGLLRDMMALQAAEIAGQQSRCATVAERLNALLDEHKRMHK
jgi:hypothetical protein